MNDLCGSGEHARQLAHLIITAILHVIYLALLSVHYTYECKHSLCPCFVLSDHLGTNPL